MFCAKILLVSLWRAALRFQITLPPQSGSQRGRTTRAQSTEATALCRVEHGKDSGSVLGLEELYLICTLEEKYQTWTWSIEDTQESESCQANQAGHKFVLRTCFKISLLRDAWVA